VHFGMGGVLVVGQPSPLRDQVVRVVTFCGSPDVQAVSTPLAARSLLGRIRGLQLVVADLRMGTGAARELADLVQKSPLDTVKWVATVGLLAPEEAPRHALYEDMHFDALPSGPFSDAMLERRFRQVVLDAGADPDNLRQMAEVLDLLRNGDAVRALAIVRRGLRRYPDSLEYVVLQCEAHLRSGRTSDALLLAMATLSHHPGYTPLRHLAARCYVAQGNLSQAFIVLEQKDRDPRGDAFALNFDTFESVLTCLNNEGVRRASAGSDSGAGDALGLYLHALDTIAGFPEHRRYVLWFNLGMAYRRKGDLQKARTALKRARDDAPPAFRDAHNALAQVEQEIARPRAPAPTAGALSGMAATKASEAAAAAAAGAPKAPSNASRGTLSPSLRTAMGALSSTSETREQPVNFGHSAADAIGRDLDTLSFDDAPQPAAALEAPKHSATLGALRSLGTAVDNTPSPPVPLAKSSSILPTVAADLSRETFEHDLTTPFAGDSSTLAKLGAADPELFDLAPLNGDGDEPMLAASTAAVASIAPVAANSGAARAPKPSAPETAGTTGVSSAAILAANTVQAEAIRRERRRRDREKFILFEKDQLEEI